MMRRIAPCFAALLALGASTAAAQPKAPTGAKKVLSVDDYARWRSVDNAIISSDGKWVAYGLRFSNTLPNDAKPVLHLRNIASGQDTEIASATSPAFSADAKWVAYQVDPLPPARGAGRGAGAPANDSSTPPTVAPATPGGRGGAPAAAAAPRRWEIRELATGKVTAWQDVQSVTFSPTSSHALLRRRAGGAPAAGGAGGGPGGGPGGPGGGFGGRGDAGGAVARGADATLLDLATGRSQFLGSMGDGAFNRSGDYLAYTVDATVRDGNGLFLIELKSGRTQVLDNDSLRYSRLTWNDKGTGLAVLKGRDIDKMRERDNRLMVVSDLSAALASNTRTPELLNPASTAGFPKGFVVSDRAPLQFSDDGARVFFGIIPQTATPDTARRRSTDSVPDVDVWRTQDERIQSQQMIQIEADRNRTFRQAYDVAANRYITLTDSAMRDIELPITGNWAVGRDSRAYISDYKPATADFYRINTATGERTLMLKGQLAGRHVNGISPDGRVFLYWKDAKFQAYDLAAGTTRTLGGSTAPNFADMDEDHPVTRQPYGVSGYAADGSSVVVEHRYDLWALPLDGSAGRNLTGGVGSRDKISLRYLRTAPLDSSVRRGARVAREIDLTKPITLSSFGEFTKKAGFSRLADGKVTSLVYEDAAFSTPLRAASADVFLLTRQTFSEFPDLVVSGNDFTDRKKISDANPQQAEYQWGRRVLFDYVTRRGDKLQGMLALPDDYKQGEKRPMLVNFYEKNSQNLNRYTPPSFLTGMGSMPIEAVSRGYITMVADVAFHTGSSHSDMLDAVEAATKKVIELGYADPKKIGVHGHSYGGEGAAFIGTRSRMFAAVGMGAGVTDLFTDFSQSWGWSYQVTGGSGQNGNDYYMEGQGRWGFSPWDKPEVYHFESALTHVPEVTQPFLIMHGTADPTVSFSEGMNFYNALRFNKKEATMLAYPGEGHGLRGMANRKDLTTRYFQFFDHYLKGTPAPSWMTDGVPYIVKTAPPKPTQVITP